MEFDRRVLKENAKASMFTAKPNAFIVTCAYLIVSWLLNVLEGNVSGIYLNYNEIAASGYAFDVIFPMVRSAAEAIRPLGWVIGAALEIMAVIITTGYSIYVFNSCRGLKAGFGNLLDGFAFFFKIIWLYFLEGVFVTLWSLLFLIPGFIATIRYSQAIYVLIENPDMRVIDCIRRSKELMRGHKWEYFVLLMSFILWMLLTVIPVAAIWVEPYLEFTLVTYYNHLTGHPQTFAKPRREEDWI